jgi:redox-sensitive bicupin YhaK (pirin superfamily)
MYAALLDGDERIERPIAQGNDVYIHVARGQVSVNFNPVQAGDAAMLIGEEHLVLDQGQDAEVLVFELW